jgi:asparagine N-glycosylation enzyme membrane subunit Stt3
VPACLGRTCAGLARGDVLMLILLAAFVALTTGFVAGCAFMWALPT